MAIETPLHSRTSVLCTSRLWRDWAGYWAVSTYDPQHIVEYFAIRNAAALIDVSPLFKYMVEGRDAVRLVNRVVTRDITRLRPGQVAYTPWCNAQGKVLDDGTVSVLGPETLRVTAAEPNYRWLSLHSSGLEATIRDISRSTAALALQGPRSREILELACNRELSSLKYFGVTGAQAGSIPVDISRTGYTGDLGYEVWVDASQAEPLWDLLMQVGAGCGIRPAGIFALDMARVEAGYIMQDVDYTGANRALIPEQLYSPYEIGLGWTVHLGKQQPFVGQPALQREKANGPRRSLVGLLIDWEHLESLFEEEGLPPQLKPMAWRTPTAIYADGRQIGLATSGTWSPLLKNDLALGTVLSAYAAPGQAVTLDRMIAHRMKRVLAHVVALPFYDPERKRR